MRQEKESIRPTSKLESPPEERYSMFKITIAPQCLSVKRGATAVEQLLLAQAFIIRTRQWASQPDMVIIHEGWRTDALYVSQQLSITWLTEGRNTYKDDVEIYSNRIMFFLLLFTADPACCAALLGYNYTVLCQSVCPLLWPATVPQMSGSVLLYKGSYRQG